MKKKIVKNLKIITYQKLINVRQQQEQQITIKCVFFLIYTKQIKTNIVDTFLASVFQN